MPRIEPYALPRNLLDPKRIARLRATERPLRMAPTRAPRMAPTWAPVAGPGSVVWEDVLAVQIPKAPRLPADLVRSFAAEQASRQR
jgi:hypothetical protein